MWVSDSYERHYLMTALGCGHCGKVLALMCKALRSGPSITQRKESHDDMCALVGAIVKKDDIQMACWEIP